MDAEFRFFLAFALLIGWLAVEISALLTRFLRFFWARVALAGVLVGVGLWSGGVLALGVMAGAVLLAALRWKRGFLWPFVIGLVGLLLYGYSVQQVALWLELRSMAAGWIVSSPVTWNTWEIAVYFRPWYGGYVSAAILWGVYRVCGRYPQTFWTRVVRQRLFGLGALFIIVSGGLAMASTLGHAWLVRVLAGPWTGFLVFWAVRGVATVMHGVRVHGLPSWIVVVSAAMVALWLGEDFLVMVWVTTGVGLLSGWFIWKKERQ